MLVEWKTFITILLKSAEHFPWNSPAHEKKIHFSDTFVGQSVRAFFKILSKSLGKSGLQFIIQYSKNNQKWWDRTIQQLKYYCLFIFWIKSIQFIWFSSHFSVWPLFFLSKMYSGHLFNIVKYFWSFDAMYWPCKPNFSIFHHIWNLKSFYSTAYLQWFFPL